MKFVIETARDVFLVRSEDQMREKFLAAIAKRASMGERIETHEVFAQKDAQINHGRWLIECECGSGVAVDPEFDNGYCFGCGAIHTSIAFPGADDLQEIQHSLLDRPKSINRNWVPSEPVSDLIDENVKRGVKRGAKR